MLILNDVIESQLNSIHSIENLKEALNLRLSLIKKESSIKNEYDKNETIILKAKTEIELIKLNEILIKKREEFNLTFETYVEELEFEAKNGTKE